MNTPEEFTINGSTYRQRYRKCGKAGCKCQDPDSPGHGPYWYKSGDYHGLKYVGKELPDAVINHLRLLETDKAELLEIQEKAQERSSQAYRAYRKAEEESRAVSALMHGYHYDKRRLTELGLERFIVE